MTNTQAKPLGSYSPAHKVQIRHNQYLLYLSGTTARQADGRCPLFGVLAEDVLKLEAQLRAKHAEAAVAVHGEFIFLANLQRLLRKPAMMWRDWRLWLNSQFS